MFEEYITNITSFEKNYCHKNQRLAQHAMKWEIISSNEEWERNNKYARYVVFLVVNLFLFVKC